MTPILLNEPNLPPLDPIEIILIAACIAMTVIFIWF